MGLKYLWDTNIVIYFLQNQFPASVERYIDSVLENSLPAFSAITEIELLCWKTASKNELTILHQFIKEANVFDLENEIKLKTAEVRKTYNVKLPDAIIAATALVYDLTLITRNDKDFKKISGLKIINPFDV